MVPADLPRLAKCEKTIPIRPRWVEADSKRFTLVASLEVDGESIEGLGLRANALITIPDRAVCFQLELHPARGPCVPLARVEWRPLRPHTNPKKGPSELQLLRLTGSHVHEFDLNWLEKQGRMRTGNLPVARPVVEDPTNFDSLLVLVQKEFRINSLKAVQPPPWRESTMFGV